MSKLTLTEFKKAITNLQETSNGVERLLIHKDDSFQFTTTDEGYLITSGPLQLKISVTINQKWILEINGVEFPFNNSREAGDFICGMRKCIQ